MLSRVQMIRYKCQVSYSPVQTFQSCQWGSNKIIFQNKESGLEHLCSISYTAAVECYYYFICENVHWNKSSSYEVLCNMLSATYPCLQGRVKRRGPQHHNTCLQIIHPSPPRRSRLTAQYLHTRTRYQQSGLNFLSSCRLRIPATGSRFQRRIQFVAACEFECLISIFWREWDNGH